MPPHEVQCRPWTAGALIGVLWLSRCCLSPDTSTLGRQVPLQLSPMWTMVPGVFLVLPGQYRAWYTSDHDVLISGTWLYTRAEEGGCFDARSEGYGLWPMLRTPPSMGDQSPCRSRLLPGAMLRLDAARQSCYNENVEGV